MDKHFEIKFMLSLQRLEEAGLIEIRKCSSTIHLEKEGCECAIRPTDKGRATYQKYA